MNCCLAPARSSPSALAPLTHDEIPACSSQQGRPRVPSAFQKWLLRLARLHTRSLPERLLSYWRLAQGVCVWVCSCVCVCVGVVLVQKHPNIRSKWNILRACSSRSCFSWWADWVVQSQPDTGSSAVLLRLFRNSNLLLFTDYSFRIVV